MKSFFPLLLVIIALAFSCNTPNSVQTTKNEQQISYTSPTVHPIKKVLKALPADSIPTSYSIKGAAIAPADFAPMMGRWVSTYDNKEVLLFSPGRYTSFYNGEKITEEKMIYYHICPDNCKIADGVAKPCFVLASDYGQSCFSIVKHSDIVLELKMLGGADDARLAYVRE